VSISKPSKPSKQKEKKIDLTRLNVRNIVILGVAVLLTGMLLMPEPSQKTQYKTLGDQVLANTIGLLFVLYILFLSFYIGLRKGIIWGREGGLVHE